MSCLYEQYILDTECISWECRSLQASEIIPDAIPHSGANLKRLNPAPLGESRVTKSTMFEYWKEVLRIYTAADLTKSSDKLVAIAGIAEALYNELDGRYTAGLWEETLLESLLWNVRQSPSQAYNHSAPYVALSWSWASQSQRIEFFSPSVHQTPLIKILETHVGYCTDSQFREVSGGYLKVRGLLARCKITTRPYAFGGGEELVLSFIPDNNANRRIHNPELHYVYNADIHSDLYLLPISHHVFGVDQVYGLILGSTAKSGEKLGEFRRWGILSIQRPRDLGHSLHM
jgi:hypothetical protein